MDILTTALNWHRQGRGVAIATVAQTWGSAPCRAGSIMIVSGEGAIEGSVSGGCVEGAVVQEALDALDDGKPRLLSYGVSDGDAFSVGLACGGTIKIFVEPVGASMAAEVLEALVAARLARTPVAYVVDSAVGKGKLVHSGYDARFAKDASGMEADGTLVVIHNPAPRLMLIGAGHIAQVLAPMAGMAGFDVTVIDPRSAFATQARFPGEVVINDDPDTALSTQGLDARTAIVVLAHDPKIDDPALWAALSSDVFYVGALGSKRTHAARCARLSEAGYPQDQIARIQGPVGLDIGAATPAEIAVSILSQLIKALRRQDQN